MNIWSYIGLVHILICLGNKYKNGYYPNRKPKKKGKAHFNSQGILVPLDGKTTKKNIKLFN